MKPELRHSPFYKHWAGLLPIEIFQHLDSKLIAISSQHLNMDAFTGLHSGIAKGSTLISDNISTGQ